MKIAVYAICLNEAAFVRRFMDSAAGADLVVIADTGSTDGTAELFEELGAVVHHIRIDPWRFDDARNAALALVPGDVDVCVSLDLDTILHPGWRAIIEGAWKGPVNQLNYTEIWARTPTGAPRQFLDNRIHARRGFRWTGPCHEYITPSGVEVRAAMAVELVMEQLTDPDKSRGQYLPMLEMAAREAPHDRRHAHYLGREYAFHGRTQDAVAEFERYLAFQPPRFNAERSATLRLMGECEWTLGHADRALALYRQAVEENPKLRGAWIDLAYAHYQAEAWSACYDAARQAIARPEGVHEYGEESWCGVLPEDLAAICGWRLGHFQDALRYGLRALELAPEVDRIRTNVERMQAALGAAAATSGQTIAGLGG
jgi:glycosyltransferase involved in cell wall biosynthesis